MAQIVRIAEVAPTALQDASRDPERFRIGVELLVLQIPQLGQDVQGDAVAVICGLLDVFCWSGPLPADTRHAASARPAGLP